MPSPTSIAARLTGRATSTGERTGPAAKTPSRIGHAAPRRPLLWALGLLLACNDGEPPPVEPTWFTTCGDPSCSGYAGPGGLQACTTEVEGQPCATAGELCDLEDDCNADLICAEEDPKADPGGCPISLRRYKHDIRYLDAAGLESVRRATLDLPLATWRYNGSDPAADPRLGFIIDDRPRSPAVAASGGHVDVYGLASMAIATVQAQEQEITRLRARQAELEARLAALEAKRP